jgi:hypothetical protein
MSPVMPIECAPFRAMTAVQECAVLRTAARNGSISAATRFRLIGAEAAARIGDHLVRPTPGPIALFPSHSYHHTLPHRAAGKRICVAFDIEAR